MRKPAVTGQISTFVFAIYTDSTIHLLHKSEISSLLAIWGCIARFVSDLVGKTKDRVSHDAAQLEIMSQIFN